MDAKEQNKIIKAIKGTNVSDETKWVICGIVKLAGCDIKRIIAILSENWDTKLAHNELDKELELVPEEMNTDYIEFLIDEIEFRNQVQKELKSIQQNRFRERFFNAVRQLQKQRENEESVE